MTAVAADTPEGWSINARGISWEAVSPGIWSAALAPGLLLVRFEPDAAWQGEDVHAAGAEELTILRGGLHLVIPGAGDVFATAGYHVRAERATRHSPKAGPQGCELLAYFPPS